MKEERKKERKKVKCLTWRWTSNREVKREGKCVLRVYTQIDTKGEREEHTLQLHCIRVTVTAQVAAMPRLSVVVVVAIVVLPV